MEVNRSNVARKNLALVQVFRGLAAIIVACYHTGTLFAVNLGVLAFNNIFKFGHCGVEFFFVLSGFIIYYIHSKDIDKSEKFLPFMKKRILRIYPIWWVVFLINLLKKPISVALFIASFFLWPLEKPYFLVTWTLSFEMFFYLIFGVFIISTKNKIINTIVSLYLVILVFFTFFGYAYIENSNMFLIHFLFNKNILNFVLGMIGGYLVVNKLVFNQRRILLLAGLIFFIASACFLVFEVNNIALHTKSGFHQQAEGITSLVERFSPLFFGVPALLIIAGSAMIDLTDSPKISKLMMFLGSASFSIYLIHAPIINIVTLKLRDVTTINMQYFVIPTILVSIFVGCCFYLIVEKPLLDFFMKKVFIKTIIQKAFGVLK